MGIIQSMGSLEKHLEGAKHRSGELVSSSESEYFMSSRSLNADKQDGHSTYQDWILKGLNARVSNGEGRRFVRRPDIKRGVETIMQHHVLNGVFCRSGIAPGIY